MQDERKPEEKKKKKRKNRGMGSQIHDSAKPSEAAKAEPVASKPMSTTCAVKTRDVVAAMDFGTSYSGYAYAFTREYKKDPCKIYANPGWTGDCMATVKAPTIVLFDKDRTFDSFGYQAEIKYAQLADKGDHVGWRYFRQFKMELLMSKITSDMMLRDDQGQEMLAIDVFAAAIEFLKSHLLDKLQERSKDIKATDIHWVLTVPAIWSDAAKQFMRNAANKAGIPSDQLTLEIEPEAAAVYCKELASVKAKEAGQEDVMKVFEPGSQFMVLDLGGGTVDITVHEVQQDRSLKELIPASGGHWGGTVVDAAINTFLVQVFGNTVMQDFRTNYKEEELELNSHIERYKRLCQENVNMRLPPTLTELFLKYHSESIEDSLDKNSFDQVKVRRGKLQFPKTTFLSMFQESKTNIIEHVTQLLADVRLNKLNTLLLVGGFSESSIIKQALRTEFATKQIIAPEDAGLSIVKGAVMLGIDYLSCKASGGNPNLIKSRILSHTYGIRISVPYDENIHSMWGYEEVSRMRVFPYMFHVFARAGSTVQSGQTKVKHTFYSDNPSPMLRVYKTKDENPVTTFSMDCEEIGCIKLKLLGIKTGEMTQIDVVITFGGTEVIVEANEHGTGVHFEALFDCLSL